MFKFSDDLILDHSEGNEFEIFNKRGDSLICNYDDLVKFAEYILSDDLKVEKEEEFGGYIISMKTSRIIQNPQYGTRVEEVNPTKLNVFLEEYQTKI